MRTSYKRRPTEFESRVHQHQKLSRPFLTSIGLDPDSWSDETPELEPGAIPKLLNSLTDPETFEPAVVHEAATLIIGHPDLVVNSVNLEHLEVLTETLKFIECQKIVVSAFSSLVLFLANEAHRSSVELLEQNEFVDILNHLYIESRDNETQVLVIELVRCCFELGHTFFDTLTEKETVAHILAFEPSDDFSAVAFAQFVRTAARHAYDEELQIGLCEQLISMCYVNENPIVCKCGFRGLHESCETSFCALAMIQEHPEFFERFAECVAGNELKIRRAAITLLISCISAPDFPLDLLLQSGAVDAVFALSEMDDDRSICHCLHFLKQWLVLPECPFVTELLGRFGSIDQVQFFSSATLDQKRYLLQIYQSIVNLNQVDLLPLFYSPEWISLICDFVPLAGGTFPVIVVDVLNKVAEMCPPDVLDEIISIVGEHEAFGQLLDLLDGPQNMDNDSLDRIANFVSQISDRLSVFGD
jgi:hypothetical protein